MDNRKKTFNEDICDRNEREPLFQNGNITFCSNCVICEIFAAPSSEEKDYFCRLPQKLQLEILKYLDRDSLIACSQVSPKRVFFKIF